MGTYPWSKLGAERIDHPIGKQGDSLTPRSPIEGAHMGASKVVSLGEFRDSDFCHSWDVVAKSGGPSCQQASNLAGDFSWK